MLSEPDAEVPRSASAGRYIGLALALVLLAALGWWLLGRDTPAPAATSVLASPAPAPASPVPAPAPTPLVTPPLVSALPPAPVPAPPRAAEPTRAAATKVPEGKGAKQPIAAASAVAEPRVYQLSELPDEIRRELPALAVGGAMYSKSPANRMLIVNGQTFREGDKLAPNLLLQQIRLKSAVLEYKGYRYGITY